MRACRPFHQVTLLVIVLVVGGAACQPISAPPPATVAAFATALPATASTAAPTATLAPLPTPTKTAQPPTGTPLPSPTAPAPTSTMAPPFELTRVSSRLAADNTAHVFGEIRNVSAQPLTRITLQLEVPGHAPIVFAPALEVIPAGQAAPFDVPLPSGLAPLANPKIAITANLPANVDAALLSVQQTKPIDPGDGQLYLNGQLVNHGTRPVQVFGLAAAVLDPGGLVRGVGQIAALVHYLAPGQRVPFSIILPGAQQDGDQWAVYLDARQVRPAGYALSATVTDAYHDECGCFRLAGLVTNPGSQPLIAPLVAAVYDAQGGLLMVQDFSTTLPVAPGASLPFGVSFGASVSTGMVPERATVQVDQAGIVPPAASAAITLPTTVLDLSQTQWELSFDSTITNTSRQTLAGIDVIVAAYDKQGRLVAAQPLSISPADGGALAPGETLALNFPLLLDGEVAPSSLKLVLLAQGRLT